MSKTESDSVSSGQMVAGNVKTAMKDAGASSSDLYMVPIDQIEVIPGFNVRDPESAKYKAKVREIADSIKANGFKKDKPLEGYVGTRDGKNVIFLTGGHTRLDGSKLAISEGVPLKALPMVVKPAGTSAEDLTVDLYVNNTGEPLDPLAVARVVHRLVMFGWTEKQIAEKLVLTVQYVKKLLTLLSAPAEIRKMVSEGKVSATLAMDTVAKHKGDAVKVLKSGAVKAEKTGKKKITKKAVSGPKPVKLDGEVYEVTPGEIASIALHVKLPEGYKIKAGTKAVISLIVEDDSI